MRTLALATTVAVALLVGASCRASQSEQVTQLPYPAQVSLVQEPAGWTYRQNATNLALYLYEPSSPKTPCTAACERQWVPLLAPASEKPLGDWTLFVRSDGRAQWAFQGHPVYTHPPDTTAHPRDTTAHAPAERIGKAWHLMPHFPS